MSRSHTQSMSADAFDRIHSAVPGGCIASSWTTLVDLISAGPGVSAANARLLTSRQGQNLKPMPPFRTPGGRFPHNPACRPRSNLLGTGWRRGPAARSRLARPSAALESGWRECRPPTVKPHADVVVHSFGVWRVCTTPGRENVKKLRERYSWPGSSRSSPPAPGPAGHPSTYKKRISRFRACQSWIAFPYFARMTIVDAPSSSAVSCTPQCHLDSI